MIIKFKPVATTQEIEQLKADLISRGFEVHPINGINIRIFALVGDTSKIDIEHLRSYDHIASVTRIQEPYKMANRNFHPEDTIIEVGDAKIGGNNLCLIAGPCSVESKEQITDLAKSVKESGANILRGGAFKPRTSPYAFQGMGPDGIELLLEAKKATGLPIISEIMDLSDLSHFEDIDILQVGARNMQNFSLLKELGKINKPILLKRGLSATYEEWLMSAEYIMSGGNEQVILCERGIRTFEKGTRNTLDLAAVPLLKSMTPLPIVVDPSHATGIRRLVRPLSHGAVAAGAHGLMIEVHNDPLKALCDGPQSLAPEAFETLAQELRLMHAFCQEKLS